MESWSVEHTTTVLAVFGVVSELIGMSKFKSNSVAQIILAGIRSLINIKGKNA